MARVKSIKCYNFTLLSRVNYATFNMQFYDSKGQLIVLDFSNPVQGPTATYCETSECIVTSDSSSNSGINCNYQSFHAGNFDKTIGLSKIGDCWCPTNLSNWLKIEFKSPKNCSSIKVCGTVVNYAATKSFTYEVEHEDNRIETHNFEFDYDAPIPINLDTYRAQSYNQDFMNSYLREMQFDSNASNYIYDTKIGYVETLDTNNFRSIPINTIEKLKSLCIRPLNTHLNCLISFDQKQTWKAFDGTNWITISDISPENIILNGMEVNGLNSLNNEKLISGGFIGDLDFKIAMKTNDTNRTPSVTKIYIEYK